MKCKLQPHPGTLSVEGNSVLRWETLVLMKISCAVHTF